MLSPISLWKHLTFTLVDSDDSLESLQPLISPLWSLRVKLKRHIACICVLFGSSFCCCFVFVLLLLLFCFRVLFYKTFAIACLCVEPERKAFKTLEFLVSLHCDIVQCEIVVVWYHYVVTLLHCGNFQLLLFSSLSLRRGFSTRDDLDPRWLIPQWLQPEVLGLESGDRAGRRGGCRPVQTGRPGLSQLWWQHSAW